MSSISSLIGQLPTLHNEPDLPPHGPGPPLFELNNIIITEEEVVDQLHILNIHVHKSTGPD